MMLVEQTNVPTAALPVAEFKDHLRLGSGFADDGLQDSLLETYLRAALAAVEARIGKALFSRSFAWSLTAWRDFGAQVLPIAPVTSIAAVTITDAEDQAETVDPGRYLLEKDMQRPRLVARALVLPSIPVGGHATIAFEAGFGPAWSDLPADLRQAVFLLAAHFYDQRGSASGEAAEMPQAVALLLTRWRGVRLFGGGAG